jgi:hypothetical protein
MKDKICKFYHKENHTVDVCYFKNGFPDNLKFKTKNSNSSANNFTTVENTNTISAPDNQQNKSVNISKDYYEMLLELICKTKASNAEPRINQLSHMNHSAAHTNTTGINLQLHIRIIYSGATYHICTSVQFFTTYHAILTININLPNGDVTVAKLCGQVKLSNSLILEDVLLVPNFKFNILAVLKIVDYLNVTFTIDKSNCIIQEKLT